MMSMIKHVKVSIRILPLFMLLKKPKNDRELYYLLIERVQKERNKNGSISLGTYEAIMYWKLYSQATAVKTICSKIRTDNRIQSNIIHGLRSIGSLLPTTLKHNINDIQKLYQSLSTHCQLLHGLKNTCALPARSTFLHFHYPDIIPIFDKQVLIAVGISEENANTKYKYLFEYIQFAWDISNDLSIFPQNKQETLLRLLDMVLWVNRGKNKCI